MNKKLEQQIAKKLTVLEQIVEAIRNTDINLNNCETWDPDYYCKLALQLLEKGKYDEFGDPITLEAGILTLLEEYHS